MSNLHFKFSLHGYLHKRASRAAGI